MNDGMRTCGKPSRGRYVQGCRCYMCRVANADYARENAHSKNKHTAMVGAKCVTKARDRVQGWLDDGHSMREVCRATGVGRNAMLTLMTGEHPNAARHEDGRPHKPHRMSRKNYEAIMGCADPSAPGAATLVDASSLNRALAWLYSHGVTPRQVAMESGIPVGSIYSIGGRERCTYATLCKLAGAAERLKAKAG